MTEQKKVYEPLIIGPAKGVIVDSGIIGGERFGIKVRVTQADKDRATNIGKHSTWTGGFSGEGMKYTLETLEALGFDPEKMELHDFHPEKIHAGKEFEFEISHYTLPAKGDKPARTSDQVKYFRFEGRGGGMGAMKLDEQESKSASESLMAKIRAHKSGSSDESSSSSGAADNSFKVSADKSEIPF